MTREEMHSLLKDLSARLPYGVILTDKWGRKRALRTLNYEYGFMELEGIDIDDGYEAAEARSWKPYLRPMSNMTKEEREFEDNHVRMMFLGDYYASRHLDYRGLIDKGLALEAPEGMYDLSSPRAKTN